MRFCTSCGKEVTPGKKFCEYCGMPLEQTDADPVPPHPLSVPAVPVSQPGIPVKHSNGSRKTLIIAGIIVALVLVAGLFFIGLPMISGSQRTGSPLPQTTTFPTPVQTLFPTPVSMEPTYSPRTSDIPTASQTYEEKYTEIYNQVYSVDHPFAGGQKEVFTQDLTTPPLYIKFNITPKMFYGEKTVDIGLSSERVISTSYTSPNAWFKVSVYDAGNGGLIEEQGFNKEHSIMTKQEFMVRKPGDYRVEMTGNDVIAEVRILTGKS